MFVNLLTRKQTLQVYGFAGVTGDKLPKRHWQVSIFPSPLDSKVHFQIRRTSFSATYGGKLFEITHFVEAQ